MDSTVPSSNSDVHSLYERVGGDPFFTDLVAAFYRGVATDEVLAPMYPEYPDLSGAEERLRLFLIQYWGGPPTYSELRGHPRLRMRHFAFRIGALERDRWLTHMVAAVDGMHQAGRMTDEDRHELLAYFIPVAEQLRNDTGLPITNAGFRASAAPPNSDPEPGA